MQENSYVKTNEKIESQFYANEKKDSGTDVYSQTEDAVLKVAAQFFGEELFPYLGIDEKPLGVCPTEVVHLEIKKMYEDFNFLMEGNRWYHLEFESDRITKEDLKRFREYEAVTSRTYGVAVTTIVVCSSRVGSRMSEFTEGLNTYRVKVVQLRDMDADTVLDRLSAKGIEMVRKEDLVPLALTPLMGGNMPEKDRIRKSFDWLKRDYPGIAREDIQKMQAVLYALAVKFLTQKDLNVLKEEIAMTILGQMLMEDGIKKGRIEGREEGMQEGIQMGREEGIQEGTQEGIRLTKEVLKLSAKGQTPEAIAEAMNVSYEIVCGILAD
ncbi:hypothetical protein NXH76_19125 [Blautia schinkii]|nr:hypothetical protein [Blautia schinkii]